MLNKKLVYCVIFFAALTFAIHFQTTSYAASLNDQAREYRDKGYTAQLAGDIDEAERNYQKAVNADPSFAAAYNDLGVIAEMRGNTASAEEDYLKAIELDSSYLPTYSNLAYLYEKKGSLLKAALFWKKRIDNGLPDDLWTKKAKDNLRRLTTLSASVRDMYLKDEAEEFAGQVMQKKINDFRQKIVLAKEHFDKGEALYNKKEFSLSLEEFKQAQKYAPNDAKIAQAIKSATKEWTDSRVNEYASNGLKYYQAGDTISARNEFKKLLAIIPASSNQKSK